MVFDYSEISRNLSTALFENAFFSVVGDMSGFELEQQSYHAMPVGVDDRAIWDVKKNNCDFSGQFQIQYTPSHAYIGVTLYPRERDHVLFQALILDQLRSKYEINIILHGRPPVRHPFLTIERLFYLKGSNVDSIPVGESPVRACGRGAGELVRDYLSARENSQREVCKLNFVIETPDGCIQG